MEDLVVSRGIYNAIRKRDEAKAPPHSTLKVRPVYRLYWLHTRGQEGKGVQIPASHMQEPTETQEVPPPQLHVMQKSRTMEHRIHYNLSFEKHGEEEIEYSYSSELRII